MPIIPQIEVGEVNGTKPFLDPKVVHLPGPGFRGKCTDTRRGKATTAGWTDEGIAFFKEAMTLNKNGRASPTAKVPEEAAKKHAREKNGVTASSLEELLRMKKRKSITSLETEEEADELCDSDGAEDE